jgi:hypothetical protein
VAVARQLRREGRAHQAAPCDKNVHAHADSPRGLRAPAQSMAGQEGSDDRPPRHGPSGPRRATY